MVLSFSAGMLATRSTKTRKGSTVRVMSEFLAAMAGAGVGLLGVVITLSVQARQEYRRGVDAAAANLVGTLGEYAAVLEARNFAWTVYSINRGQMPDRVRAELPEIALDLLVISTRGRDRAEARKFVVAFKAIRKSADVSSGTRWLARAVTQWRADGVRGEALDSAIETATLRANSSNDADDIEELEG